MCVTWCRAISHVPDITHRGSSLLRSCWMSHASVTHVCVCLCECVSQLCMRERMRKWTTHSHKHTHTHTHTQTQGHTHTHMSAIRRIKRWKRWCNLLGSVWVLYQYLHVVVNNVAPSCRDLHDVHVPPYGSLMELATFAPFFAYNIIWSTKEVARFACLRIFCSQKRKSMRKLSYTRVYERPLYVSLVFERARTPALLHSFCVSHLLLFQNSLSPSDVHAHAYAFCAPPHQPLLQGYRVEKIHKMHWLIGQFLQLNHYFSGPFAENNLWKLPMKTSAGTEWLHHYVTLLCNIAMQRQIYRVAKTHRMP